jgi:hypothetical protein
MLQMKWIRPQAVQNLYQFAASVPMRLSDFPRSPFLSTFASPIHRSFERQSLIPIQAINQAQKRILKSDVKFRFVIDMGNLKNWDHKSKTKPPVISRRFVMASIWTLVQSSILQYYQEVEL